MAAGVQDIEVGFEEAVSRLPFHVRDEAVLETRNKNKDDLKCHYYRHRSKLPTEPFPPHSKASSRRHHKSRHWGNWASGGHGMQAFFLDSGHKSSGTGVFLPQGAGTNFQLSRRPVCSTVLLPSRVVQALNLNVHELGLRIPPRRDSKSNNTSRGREFNSSLKNKYGKDDVLTKRCVISQNENSSPEIYLPKEWTY
ncbi:hypothetical protein DITRI_Ditri13aG0089800 [Diplodiscus trichospermus]